MAVVARVRVLIEQFWRADGQILLPILELIENASQVVQAVIHEVGQQTLEQILVRTGYETLAIGKVGFANIMRREFDPNLDAESRQT